MADLLERGSTGPDAGAFRDALLAQAAGDRMLSAAIHAGWELGGRFTARRADELDQARDGIFVQPEDVTKQIGSEVRRSAERISKRNGLDADFVLGAALFSMRLHDISQQRTSDVV